MGFHPTIQPHFHTSGTQTLPPSRCITYRNILACALSTLKTNFQNQLDFYFPFRKKSNTTEGIFISHSTSCRLSCRKRETETTCQKYWLHVSGRRFCTSVSCIDDIGALRNSRQPGCSSKRYNWLSIISCGLFTPVKDYTAWTIKLTHDKGCEILSYMLQWPPGLGKKLRTFISIGRMQHGFGPGRSPEDLHKDGVKPRKPHGQTEDLSDSYWIISKNSVSQRNKKR